MIGMCATVSTPQIPGSSAPDNRPLLLTQTASRFEDNMLTLVEAMPTDKFNFAPSKDLFKLRSPAEFATVRTFAQQLAHVCVEPDRLFGPFRAKPDTDVDSESLASLQTKDEIIRALKDSFAYQDKVIADTTPENAFAPAGPHYTTRISALIAILGDDGDHYGQLVKYLRMNGIVPPATIT